jgi:hypothetical protein
MYNLNQTEITSLIEGYLLFYDWQIYDVAHIVYRNMRDESFFWTAEKFMAKPLNDESFRLYDLLIQNIGYYSGGFSLEYLLFIKELIKHTPISVEHKLSMVNGIMLGSKFSYYRDESVFDQLQDICMMLQSEDFYDIYLPIQNNISNLNNILTKRKEIIQQVTDKRIVMPDELLSEILLGKSKASKRFLGMQFNTDTISFLVHAMQNSWGIHGHWDIDKTCEIIKHSRTTEIWAINYEYQSGLEIVWKQNRGVFYAIKANVSMISPFPEHGWSSIDESEWCDVSYILT